LTVAREDGVPATLARAAKLSVAIALAVALGGVSNERGVPSAWPLLCASPAVAEESSTSGVFHGVGIVKAIDGAKGWLTLDHKAIAGFMDAMEMMYRVEPPRLIAGLKVGDHVAFDIDAARYAIVGVKVLDKAK
jgi:Cu/Ag efflux protein CusF